ncbi:DEAD/DEAH box helicase family protein [uncultured Desulfovibrio sp.]|uniref:DEAD/DEAH box helicase n=1 Tax=uncultured Desulfovibrio sp. TaxID=167968 RepID=UPI00280461AF|nr:DEAD/DEAH box helicase family protein [uncultured Desulfovibrio sp.]
MILRPYQETMVDRALAALNARGNTLTVAPTGAGKTIILSAVAGRLGGKQCVLQHRDELVTQNLRKYRAVNPGRSVGMFTADAKNWRAETTFAMVQTLQRNLASLPKLDALIIDEAHHAVANGYLKIVKAVREKNPACRIFGVTATPARGDGKGLREVFDNCADQISLHSLVSMGFLVRPRTYICTLTGTDEKLASLRKMHNGEYDMHEAAQILDVAVHNEAVVREWRKLAGERKTIVFCSTVEHARHVLDAFLAAGVRAAMVTGEMPLGARKAMLESFDAQDAPNGVQVLINVAVLTEGYDSQPVSCVVLLRPCSQKSTMLQMIGRGLRTVDPTAYPGVVKKDCIVLDFGNSLLTHGDLESKVRIDDRQKVCPECCADVPYGSTECPICGHAFKPPQRGAGADPDAEDGPEAVSDVTMEEVNILDASPFRWCDIFGSGKVMLASGFEAWSAVCSADGETWQALGRMKGERELRRLALGERISALAAADDFLRMHESDDAAKKNKRWLNDPCTERQWQLLQSLGYGRDMLLSFTKYSAACTLNFFWNRRLIEGAILHGCH